MERWFPVVIEVVGGRPWSCLQGFLGPTPSWKREDEGPELGASQQVVAGGGGRLCTGGEQPDLDRGPLTPQCGCGVEPHFSRASQPPFLGFPKPFARSRCFSHFIAEAQ